MADGARRRVDQPGRRRRPRLAGRLRSHGERSGGGLQLVVGPSGCGKSSLVRAGLAARMAAEPNWEVAQPFLPGSDPIGGLAWALAATANQRGLGWTVADARVGLESKDGLATLADEILVAGPGAARERLLLVVDQGEELLTRTDPAERGRIAALLQRAAAGRVRPVLTLRSEFQERFLALVDIEVDIYPLRPLSRDMLRVVIEQPARLAGLSVDHELVDRLVADTDSGEALPLLAFTLNRLADGLVRGDLLTAARYNEIGGVEGALARHADAALTAAVGVSGLTREEVLTALIRLATLDPAGQPTRQRIALTELSEPERLAFTVFVDHRMLTTAGADDGIWVGVAHEALLTSWRPLAEAITARTVALHTSRSVQQAAGEWDQADRPDDHLWERGRVMDARRVLDLARLSGPAAAFLRASQRHDDRVRMRAVALLSVALLLVSAGGIAALGQWRVALSHQAEARGQRRVAIARQLAGQAVVLRQSQRRIALALSIEAYQIDSFLPEVRDSLLSMQSGYYSDVLQPGLGAVHGVAFDPGGGRLAAAVHDDAVVVWRLPDRSAVRLPTTGPVFSVPFSPNGELLAAAGDSGTIEVWNARTLRPVRIIPAGREALYTVAFSPDSMRLAAGGSAGEVVLLDVRHGWRAARVLGASGPGGAVNCVAFGPDANTLATANSGPDGVVTFWDIQSGRATPVLGHSGPVRALAVSPDGRLLASGGDDGAVRLWDARSHLLMTAALEHAGAVQTVAFSPHGRLLASAGDDGAVRLWDVGAQPRSLSQLTSLLGPTDRVLGVAFSSDGRTLAGGGSASGVGLWRVSRPPDRNLPAVYAAAAFSRGGILATAGRDRQPRLWDLTGRLGTQVRQLFPPGEPPSPDAVPAAFGMVFTPDGKTLASPASRESAALWDLASGGRQTRSPG